MNPVLKLDSLPPSSPKLHNPDLSTNPSVVQIHEQLRELKGQTVNIEDLFRAPGYRKLASLQGTMLRNLATHLEPFADSPDFQSFRLDDRVHNLQRHVASLTLHLSYNHSRPRGEPPPSLEGRFLRLEQTLDRMRRFHYFKLTDSKVAFSPD